MKTSAWWLSVAVSGVSIAPVGCQQDNRPPPPRVAVPQDGAMRESNRLRPPPDERDLADRDRSDLPPPPFEDVPLVSQAAPEQRAYVRAYQDVGRPRLVVFVNRAHEGNVMPVDAEAMENILIDWLAADGQVQIVSPSLVRDRLTNDQTRELQAGGPQMRGELAKLLDADVLVQVQAHSTRQTQQGSEVRLVAEAVNIRQDSNSIARAVVDIPPPLDKPKLNKYTRFVARKLMDGMTGTWTGYASRPADPPPPSHRPEQAPQPDAGPRDAAPPPGLVPPRTETPPASNEILPPQPQTAPAQPR